MAATVLQVQNSNKQGKALADPDQSASMIQNLKQDRAMADAAAASVSAAQFFTKPNESVVKIGIEGNIAAGKSTFLRILAKELDFYVVQEPVSKWQQVESENEQDKLEAANQNEDCKDLEEGEDAPQEQESGGNLLELFYNDPKRWTYTFQSYAFLSRMRAQMTPIEVMQDRAHKDLGSKRNRSSAPSGVKMMGPSAKKRRLNPELCDAPQPTTQDENGVPPAPEAPETRKIVNQFFERSVYSDRYCFAALCHKMGNMKDLEYSIYKDWHNWLCTLFPTLKLHGMIYLRSDPSVCKQRLGKRGRDEEVDTVGLDYLTALHDAHESWLMRKEHKDPVARTISNLPLLVIDVNEDFESNPAVQAKHLKRIHTFLANIKRTL